MASARLWLVLAIAALAAPGTLAGARAADPTPKRYALLVAVTDYDHAEMNRPKLVFPEIDAESVATFLEDHGYDDVDRLFGQAASREAILAKLAALREKGNRTGAVVVGFWGHGVQYDPAGEAYFCPVDAKVRPVTDGAGRRLPDAEGHDRLEPDPATLVGMGEVLAGLRAAGGGQRILLADCCRDDPSTARGRAFGSTTKLSDLPPRTAALFACSEHEKAFEDPEWGHGAFTKCLLDRLRALAEGPEDDINQIAAPLEREVAALVDRRSRGRETQTVNFVASGVTRLRLDRGIGKQESTPNQPPPPAPAGPKPGEVITNSLGMKLVRIPAGEFSMGSEETKEDLRRDITAAGITFYEDFDSDDERPVHRVAITRPFLLGQTEVTLGQFLAFYNDGFKGKLDCEKDGEGGWGWTGETFSQESRFRPWSWGHPDMDLSTEAGKQKAFRYPVVNVSWNDAVAFCEWLSKKEGKKYRLPTEAEWEYACRGGTQSRYWFGEDFEKLSETDNVGDQTAKDRFRVWSYHIRSRDGFAFTSPVGAYRKPNPFGLFDMHGNVSEWCSDWYGADYYGQSPVADPKGPDGPSSAGSFRVIRGGGWGSYPVHCRSAYRGYATSANRYGYVGFRVVQE